MNDILEQLTEVLEQRNTASSDSSYLASLYGNPLDAILKKVCEEATETFIAAKHVDPEKIVYDTDD